MKFQIILPKSVQKELDRLPDEIASRIMARLARLESNPRPADGKKLKGLDAWRIRVGDYRVIYEIHDRVLQTSSLPWGTAGKFTAETPTAHGAGAKARNGNLSAKTRRPTGAEAGVSFSRKSKGLRTAKCHFFKAETQRGETNPTNPRDGNPNTRTNPVGQPEATALSIMQKSFVRF